MCRFFLTNKNVDKSEDDFMFKVEEDFLLDIITPPKLNTGMRYFGLPQEMNAAVKHAVKYVCSH